MYNEPNYAQNFGILMVFVALILGWFLTDWLEIDFLISEEKASADLEDAKFWYDAGFDSGERMWKPQAQQQKEIKEKELVWGSPSDFYDEECRDPEWLFDSSIMCGNPCDCIYVPVFCINGLLHEDLNVLALELCGHTDEQGRKRNNG